MEKLGCDVCVSQGRWEDIHLSRVMQDKTVCLICNKKVSVQKEYSLFHHYEKCTKRSFVTVVVN